MRLLPLVLIVFLAACGQSSTNGTASTEQSSNAGLSYKYQCESGKTIRVSYPTESTAIVEYNNRRLQMKIAVSGSGARYVGERLEWWTKGRGEGTPGTLLRHLKDGTPGEEIEQCAQIADAP